MSLLRDVLLPFSRLKVRLIDYYSIPFSIASEETDFISLDDRGNGLGNCKGRKANIVMSVSSDASCISFPYSYPPRGLSFGRRV